MHWTARCARRSSPLTRTWGRCTLSIIRCGSSMPGPRPRPACASLSNGAIMATFGAPSASARTSSKQAGWRWWTRLSTSCSRMKRAHRKDTKTKKKSEGRLVFSGLCGESGGSMPIELPKQYDPHAAQQRWLDFWEQQGYFHSRPDPNRQPYCIVIPPPNVTGALHMGHALNNTLQDVLIRWRRMQGYNALWMPGTDHAGIATQAVVERRLREEEGKTRHDLGREKLVERIWQWKDQYEARILRQLRELGCSCDWQRTRFTLDPICARAVRVTFFHMFRDGLIHRGKRLVNWDAQLQTAVADDEIYHETVKGG